MDIEHEIKIAATPEKVFSALTTLDGIKSWFTDCATKNGNTWELRPDNRLDYHFEEVEVSPSSQVRWKVSKGPNAADRSFVEFQLKGLDDGRTLVDFAHTGWPDDAQHFKKCNTYWGLALGQLRSYLEKGTVSPAF